MSNPAEVGDLQALGWTGDTGVAQGWLDAAWVVLAARIPTLDASLDSGDISFEPVVYVVVQMALRALRNPLGREQESISLDDATHSWTLDKRLASGRLSIEDEELAMLTGRRAGRIFSVQPL